MKGGKYEKERMTKPSLTTDTTVSLSMGDQILQGDLISAGGLNVTAVLTGMLLSLYMFHTYAYAYSLLADHVSVGFISR